MQAVARYHYHVSATGPGGEGVGDSAAAYPGVTPPAPAPQKRPGSTSPGGAASRKAKKPRDYACNVWNFALEASGSDVTIGYMLAKLQQICTRFIFVVEHRKIRLQEEEEEHGFLFRGRVFLLVS